jgi:hypothetical protein
VRAHPNGTTYEINRENRNALYDNLLPIIRAWNDGAQNADRAEIG